jgi:hypothetical protein
MEYFIHTKTKSKTLLVDGFNIWIFFILLDQYIALVVDD